MKLTLGVLALVVPMALVMYVWNGIGSMVLGVLAMAFMFMYTANKFRGIGKRRGYHNLADAFAYSAIGNGVIAFTCIMVVGVIARLSANNFRTDPVMLCVAYFALIGGIIAIVRLIKNDWLDGWGKAQCIFGIGFALGLMSFCIAESVVSFPEALYKGIMILMLMSGAAVAVCGWKISVYDVEHA